MLLVRTSILGGATIHNVIGQLVQSGVHKRGKCLSVTNVVRMALVEARGGPLRQRLHVEQHHEGLRDGEDGPAHGGDVERGARLRQPTRPARKWEARFLSCLAQLPGQWSRRARSSG